MKTALITGVGGQDGSYLAEYLLGLGYEVHGITRGMAYETLNVIPKVRLHVGDMRDEITLENIFRKVWPDEVYNLAAQVFVPTSWTQPTETFDVNVGGLARLLKVVDTLKISTKVYQASSSEMFGNTGGSLNENSPLCPVSPYGVSKMAAHKLCHVYREKGLFVVSGILFNHESPRRGDYMVTRKITRKVARWATGERVPLELGNMKATRDWGHARDYVKAMWLMMQQDKSADYVIGTGVSHSVWEFFAAAVIEAGLEWKNVKDMLLENSGNFFRTNELLHLNADAEKARRELGWKPEITFPELVREMVQEDIKKEQKRKDLKVMAEK